MIEMRWVVERWEEFPEFGMPIRKYSEPKLQYRWMENTLEIGLHDCVWSEWTEAPTEYIEV